MRENIKGTIALTEEQYNKVYKEQDNLVNFILNTGLRRHEVYDIINSKEEISDRMFIKVKYSHGNEVPITLSNAAKGYLLALREEFRDYSAKFSSWEKMMLRRVKSVCLKATGYDYFSPHSLRATFATRLNYNVKADIATIQSLMNHKDISTTSKYIKPNHDMKKQYVEQLVHTETWEGKTFEELKLEILRLREDNKMLRAKLEGEQNV